MKRGGSKMGYTEQFNLLSPCYKDGEQPAGFHMGGVKGSKKGKKATKKTTTVKKSSTKKTKSSSKKQKGGSSCGASPSVSEMGVNDRPASLEPTASELAWDNRMKGGDATLVGNVKPTKANQSTNNLFSLNTPPPVNTNNSPLNKIKNELFPDGTSPELVMKLIRTNKNLTKPSDSTYSVEIFYRVDGNNEIKKSVKSDVTFPVFLKEYHTISGEVFPPPTKNVKVSNAAAVSNANGTVKTNANTKPNANAKPNANTKPNANAKPNANTKPNANAKTNGTVKPKANANLGLGLGF